jgi:hypothetical protein
VSAAPPRNRYREQSAAGQQALTPSNDPTLETLPAVTKIGLNAEGVFGKMDGRLTPDEFASDRDDGFVHRLMTEDLAAAIAAAHPDLPADQLKTLVGKLVAIPSEWDVAGSGAVDVASVDVSATDTVTATDTGSGGGDYGSSSRPHRLHTRRSRSLMPAPHCTRRASRSTRDDGGARIVRCPAAAGPLPPSGAAMAPPCAPPPSCHLPVHLP